MTIESLGSGNYPLRSGGSNPSQNAKSSPTGNQFEAILAGRNALASMVDESDGGAKEFASVELFRSVDSSKPARHAAPMQGEYPADEPGNTLGQTSCADGTSSLLSETELPESLAPGTPMVRDGGETGSADIAQKHGGLVELLRASMSAPQGHAAGSANGILDTTIGPQPKSAGLSENIANAGETRRPAERYTPAKPTPFGFALAASGGEAEVSARVPGLSEREERELERRIRRELRASELELHALTVNGRRFAGEEEALS